MKLHLIKTITLFFTVQFFCKTYANQPASPYQLAITNFKEKKYNQSFSQTKILELDQHQWLRDLQSVYWLQLNIIKSYCDKVLFEKTKKLYLKKYSKIISKILNQSDLFNEPEYIYLFNQSPTGAIFLQKYNNAQDEKEKIFYRTQIETELIINHLEHSTIIWNWHELIKNIQLTDNILKTENNIEMSEFKWPLTGELWPDEIDKIETLFRFNCQIQGEMPNFPNLLRTQSLRILSDIKFATTFKELNKNIEENYRANEESEKINLLWIQKMADYWIYLFSTRPLASEDENQGILNKWEARLRESIIQIHKKYLVKKATPEETILAYKIYLSSIRFNRFELAIKKNLAKIYADQQLYTLAGKLYRDLYDYKQDNNLLIQIGELYKKELSLNKNNLSNEQAKFALKRSQPAQLKK
jgi:hypothetical protein